VYGGSRSARRYRTQRKRSGLAPVAAQLAVPVALGLLIGGVLAYQAGSTNNLVQPVPLGAVPTPTPSFGAPSASTPAVTTPAPAVITPTPAATAMTPAATAMTNGNCAVIVPANPLSARRLVTVYQLTGEMTSAKSGCTLSNAVKQTATANASGR
jgi:hypothetical protein